MEKLLSDKIQPALVGLYQAVGVAAYSALVAGFVYFMGQSKIRPGYLGIVFMLVLFVFSAGITGSLVFGLPAYFALKNNVSRAVSVLAYTFVYLLSLLVVTALIIVAIY